MRIKFLLDSHLLFLHPIIKVRFVFVYIPFTCGERVIVRTAIPYSSTLQDMLDADWSFLIVMISITLVMSVVAYFTTRRLGKDIERVNRYEAEQRLIPINSKFLPEFMT